MSGKQLTSCTSPNLDSVRLRPSKQAKPGPQPASMLSQRHMRLHLMQTTNCPGHLHQPSTNPTNLQPPPWAVPRSALPSIKQCRLKAAFYLPPHSTGEPSPPAVPLSQPPTLRPRLPAAPPSGQPQPPQQPPSQQLSCGNSLHCQVRAAPAIEASHACWRQAKPQSSPCMGPKTLQAASWRQSGPSTDARDLRRRPQHPIRGGASPGRSLS